MVELDLSLTNTYDRENIFYFDRVRFERVNQLPLLPSVGVELQVLSLKRCLLSRLRESLLQRPSGQ